ncbi:conserved exported hypothetical protein [Candidatus Sulfopaludibacter sp. SbA3]|nr:conserved exported hypothetical protein [Candidatus Sulfopaludibacter sp. SbA3]
MKKTLCLAALAVLVATIASAQDYPRAETFAGFTYTRANSASNVPAFSANGGGGQLAVNANKWVGFVMDIGAVHNGNINSKQLDSTFTNFLFGPRISLRYSRLRPYFNVLFGGMHAGTSVDVSGVPVAGTLPVYLPGSTTPVPPGQAVSLRATASQTSFAMATGGGLDIKINRHVSFRAIGLDYLMTRLQNLRTANDNNQHNLRYTTGFNFTFGGEAPVPPPPPPPPPPPMKACPDGSSVPAGAPCPLRNMDLQMTSKQAELCEGGIVTLTPAGAPQDATYQWTVEGQPTSTAPSFDFGGTGREPGAYKVVLTVSAPDYNPVTTSTNITVRAYRAPSGTLEATPQEVMAGEKVNLAANFTPGQCGGSLRQPVFTASEGTVTGTQFDSSEVRFDPAATSEQRKTVTIVAKVADDKGSGTAQATVLVKKPALAKRLPDIVFPDSSARVNNCGKRVLLEELKTFLESDPTGKVVLVGHLSEKEAAKAGLDQTRALNAAAVISAGNGICYGFPASQILVGAVGAADNGVDYQSHFCGSTQELPGSLVKESESEARYRRVEVWFVPGSGVLPASVKDYKDAVSLSVSALGCPR